MSKNNIMFKMFREMKEGYKTKQDALFSHGARCWMEEDPEDPFQEGTEASEMFLQMKMNFSVWKMRGADYKVHWRRMLESARKLCALNPRQPYKFDKKAEEEELAAKRKWEEEQAQIAEQKRIEKEKAEAEKPKPVIKEEPLEEVDYTKPNIVEPTKQEPKKIIEKPVKKVEEHVKVQTEKSEEEPQHVFGVIPEEKQGFFKKFFGKFKK